MKEYNYRHLPEVLYVVSYIIEVNVLFTILLFNEG